MGEICGSCFSETVNEQGVCTVCGYDCRKNRDIFPQSLPNGAILYGRYILGKVLGQGGFGITYLAQDYQTKKIVAIKEFFPDTMATRKGSITVAPFSGERGEHFTYGKATFMEEAKTMAKFIGEKGIVQVYGYFEENNTGYFVMEYVNGRDLRQYIRQNHGRTSWEDALHVMLPVMDALSVIHEKGFIHRDVTPDNIYIRKDGTVCLLDFGAARHSLGNVSQSLDVVLKHGFAPKEQYQRRGRQGPYTDVYSVAATIYYAVTGVKPEDAIERLDEDRLIPPSRLEATITLEQENVLLKGLALKAGDRYQTMREFREALVAVTYTKATPACEKNVTTIEKGSDARTNMDQPVEKQIPEVSETVEKPKLPLSHLNIHKEMTFAPKDHPAGKYLSIQLDNKKEFFSVPKDIQDGQTIQLKGKGKYDSATGCAGDLYITIHIKEAETTTSLPNKKELYVAIAAVTVVLIIWLFASKGTLWIRRTAEDTPKQTYSASGLAKPSSDGVQTNPTNTSVQSSTDSEASLTWELSDDGTLVVSGSGDMDEMWGIYQKPWNSQRYQIKRVILRQGVTSIGNYAFNECIYLTTITIPDSVTKIGKNAFYDCDLLANITIPNSVTSIGEAAFLGCDSITAITIPEGVTTILESTFHGCDDLQKITLSKNVTSIEERAFYDCVSLTSVNIPDGVTRVGNYAVCNCNNLTNISIPSSVIYLHLDGANKLTTIYYKGTESQWDSLTKYVPYSAVVVFA